MHVRNWKMSKIHTQLYQCQSSGKRRELCQYAFLRVVSTTLHQIGLTGTDEKQLLHNFERH